MKHIFFIDPLEKLAVRKDSTLLAALTLREAGGEAYVMFEKDFSLGFGDAIALEVYEFTGRYDENFTVDHFRTTDKRSIAADGDCTIHMRLDPPFDSRYLRYLWMLGVLEKSRSVRVINGVAGLLKHNEKLCPLALEGAIPSFVGTCPEGFRHFCRLRRQEGFGEAVLKPMDLYQGMGVEKISLDDQEAAVERFTAKAKRCAGPLIVQPFVEGVYLGEVRSIYYGRQEVASIVKTPRRGGFLANVAQGARVGRYTLDDNQRRKCEAFCRLLSGDGIEWVAFDLLGGFVSEVNVTCPGLLVESSKAWGKNLAIPLVRRWLS